MLEDRLKALTESLDANFFGIADLTQVTNVAIQQGVILQKIFIICGLLVLLIKLPCYAQVSFSDFVSEDPRLAKPVSIKATETTLPDLMKQLSEQSGVALSVDSAPKAWSLRERRVRFIFNQVPLSQVMSGVKMLMLYSWKRVGKEEEWQYVLYQSEKDRIKEAKYLDAYNQSKKDWDNYCNERIRKLADYYQSVLKKSGNSSDSDPFALLCSNWEPARAMAQLMGSMLPQLDGQSKVNFAYSQMSPQTQELLKTYLVGNASLYSQCDTSYTPLPIPEDDLKNLRVILEKPTSDQGSTAIAVLRISVYGSHVAKLLDANSYPGKWIDPPLLSGSTRCCYSNGPDKIDYDVSLPLSDPQSAFNMRDALFALEKLNYVSKNQITNLEQSCKKAETNSDFKQSSGLLHFYSKEKPPKDPALLREVALDGKLFNSVKNYDTLSQKIGYSILADAYTELSLEKIKFYSRKSNGGLLSTILPLPAENEKMPLYLWLNKAGDAGRFDWQAQGYLLLLSDVEWYLKRSWQIPLEWEQYYDEKLKPSSKLPLADRLMLAHLTEEQLINLSQTGSSVELKSNVCQIYQDRNCFLLYDSLNSAQKMELNSKKGLPTSKLSLEQWNLAVAALDDLHKVSDEWLPGGVIFSEKLSAGLKFGFRSSNGHDTVEIIIDCVLGSQ